MGILKLCSSSVRKMQHRQTGSSFAPPNINIKAYLNCPSFLETSRSQKNINNFKTNDTYAICHRVSNLSLRKCVCQEKTQFQPSSSPSNCGIQHGNSILLLVRKHTPTKPYHSRNYLVILRIRHVSLAPRLGKYIIPVSTSLPIISHGGFPLKVQAIAGPDEVVHLGIASNACNNNSLVDSHCWSLGNAKLGLHTSTDSRGTKWTVG